MTNLPNLSSVERACDEEASGGVNSFSLPIFQGPGGLFEVQSMHVNRATVIQFPLSTPSGAKPWTFQPVNGG